ncbi:hypothetical protein Trydic_g3088 [Trypoxylus dichotomus]
MEAIFSVHTCEKSCLIIFHVSTLIHPIGVIQLMQVGLGEKAAGAPSRTKRGTGEMDPEEFIIPEWPRRYAKRGEDLSRVEFWIVKYAILNRKKIYRCLE